MQAPAPCGGCLFSVSLWYINKIFTPWICLFCPLAGCRFAAKGAKSEKTRHVFSATLTYHVCNIVITIQTYDADPGKTLGKLPNGG